jgi:outer membrane protein insertion porin family
MERHQEYRQIPALISNLNSHFRSPERLGSVYIFTLAWIFACSMLAPSIAYSLPWSVSENLEISKSEQSRLKKRTPEILSNEDADLILTSISLRHPFTSLWIEHEDGHLIVKGFKGTPITKIDFKLAPLALLPNLRSAASAYVGQVHSAAIQDKISRDIHAILARQGYQNGKANFELIETEDGIVYQYKLDIGDPCIIRGYKWESTPPLRVEQALKVGDICDIDDAAKTISETESKARAAGFAEASISFDGFQFDSGSRSAWVLVKGTFGNKIIYEFEDQTTGRNLNSLFTNNDMQVFDPAILSPESVGFELMRQLKKRGYASAQITNTSILESGNGETIHKFTVLLGEVSVISRLQIDGNNYFQENEILNFLGIERPIAIEGNTEEVVFNPDAVADGVEKIRTAYVNQGFWDVKVSDRQVQSQVRNGKSNHIVVVISIEEGERRIFNRLEFNGNATIPTNELTDLNVISMGDPMDRSKIVDLQQKIRSLYASKGYFYTATNAETKGSVGASGNNEVTVKITIDEGPRVRFGDVFITGLVRTDPKVVMRELFFETGDWYDPELLSATRRALLRIGVFSTVVIIPLDPDLAFKRSEMVDLVIQVSESPSRTVSFGPGWSSYYGMRYNVEGALTNIAGTGRQLFGRASFNEEAHQKAIGPRTLIGRSISAGYLEPHIGDSVLDGTLAVSQAARATEYAWSLTKSGEVELSHSLRSIVPGSKISTFYSRKINEEEGAKEDVDAFLTDTFTVGRMGLRFLIDKRNDVTWVSSGYTLSSELAWARYDLGGDLRYFRWEVTNNHYFSPLENLVFAFGVNFTSFEDVERRGQANGDVLPASERLPAGGADSIRGFKERSLGPIVRRPSLNALNQWDCGYTASPTGGSRRLILKAETRYRFTTAIAGSLFLDSGTSSFSQDEISKFQKAFAASKPPENEVGCAGTATKSIEDNNSYELKEVAKDPRIIWEQNYSSVGTSISFLTPIGSINLAYGVPWHEPKSDECKKDKSKCYPRSDPSVPLWRRGEYHLNVGAKF